MDSLEDRVKALEEWREQEGINHDVNVKLAESWIKDYIDLKDRIEALARQQVIDNKTLLDSVVDYHADKKELKKRIETLEEWVEEHRQEFALEKLGTTKMIDKQVWEKIKHSISIIYHIGMDKSGSDVEFRHILENIKKVNPEWEP